MNKNEVYMNLRPVISKQLEVDVEKIRAAATGDERDRVDEIIALGTQYDCSDLTNPMIRDAVSVVDDNVVSHLYFPQQTYKPSPSSS